MQVDDNDSNKEAEDNDNESNSIDKVVLSNSTNVGGNYNFNFSPYGLNISYNGEYVVIVNWQTLYLHGNDTNFPLVKDEKFSQVAGEFTYHNGNLYYLVEDGYSTEYYLYSWNFENDSVKVSDTPIKDYLILNNQVIFTTDFFAEPLHMINLDNGSVSRLTQSSANEFTTDGVNLYYRSDDFGNAPGLIKYDVLTQEESLLIFPFYSQNFIVHNGYIYYESEDFDNNNIIRQSLTDETITIIQEINTNAVSINISDDILYFQTDSYIKSCNLDGTETKLIYQSENTINIGTFIIGDRIYFNDGISYYMIKKDGSNFVQLDFDN